jgi:hypothetical protein
MSFDVAACLAKLREHWPPQSVSDIAALYEPCATELSDAEAVITPLERQLSEELGVSADSLRRAKAQTLHELKEGSR